jgi:hypothetical protein
MDTVSDQVEEGPGLITEPPAIEPPMEQAIEQPVAIEQPLEQAIERPVEKPKPKVRKVRVRAPTDPVAPVAPVAPDPNYWRSRLEEHLTHQREAKSERYANLRIM